MPISDNNFQWRPNDNGSLTNLRYDLEAEKWIQSVRRAETKLSRRSIKHVKGDLGIISMVLTIPLLLLIFMILIPVQIVKVVFRYNFKIFPGDPPTGKILTDKEKFDIRIKEIKRRYSSSTSRRTIPTDMTEEEMIELAAYVRVTNNGK
ncbi:hypothetical protein E0K83_06495 [Gramella sp. BOM4]|nr:hypothetical protein [Christiangramia bathymodioli]